MLFLSPCLPSQFYSAHVFFKLPDLSFRQPLLHSFLLIIHQRFSQAFYLSYTVSLSNFSHSYFPLKALGSSSLGISPSLITPVVRWYNSHPSWVKLVPLRRLPGEIADLILVVAISGNMRCYLTVGTYLNNTAFYMIFEIKRKRIAD